jgi:hypothetical protein
MSQQPDEQYSMSDRDHVVQFLAELMTATQGATTPPAFQRAVQAYCEELRPWVLPADVPSTPRAVFALFEECTIDEETDAIQVRFSPEGAVFFRAWRRQRGIMEATGGVNDPGWSQ